MLKHPGGVAEPFWEVRHAYRIDHSPCAKIRHAKAGVAIMGIRFNYVGNRYGKLVVVRRAETIRKRNRCECVCDCGNTITVMAQSLRSGNTRSCGCLHAESCEKVRERTARKQGDLTGCRFEKLLVLEFSHYKNGAFHWRCKCDCGKISNPSYHALVSGHSKSCGCQAAVRSRETGLARRGKTRRGEHAHNWVDLAGKSFGRLTVVHVSHLAFRGPYRKRWMYFWKCQCKCGKEIVTDGGSLRSGSSQSCGCLLRDAITKHGLSKHPLYQTWKGMKDRCSKTTSVSYPGYGGRGISVCERWQSLHHFVSDMGERPSPDHSLDRINNDGNYEPGNVRWAIKKEQGQNTRFNVNITHDGKTLCLTEWARELGVSPDRVYKSWRDVRRAKANEGKVAVTRHSAAARYIKTSKRIRCYWCNELVPLGDRHIDHIIPVAKGGSDEASNLCCACQDCNLSKWNKLPAEHDGQNLLDFSSTVPAAIPGPEVLSPFL